MTINYWLVLFGLLLSSYPAAAQDILALEWEDLLPEKDLQAYLNAPEINHDVTTGEDPLSLWTDEMRNALQSVDVNPEYINRKIMLPGFMVPLAYDEERRVTEFFLVPFFGACIHLPPPPPNQLVYVSYADGVPLREMWEPFIIQGTLLSEITDAEPGRSAYTMNADDVSLLPY